MARKSLATRMLSVAKVDRSQRQVQVCLDGRAEENVAIARRKYREMLGRDVSASMVVRRALALLAQYVVTIDREDWADYELTYMARHLR